MNTTIMTGKLMGGNYEYEDYSNVDPKSDTYPKIEKLDKSEKISEEGLIIVNKLYKLFQRGKITHDEFFSKVNDIKECLKGK